MPHVPSPYLKAGPSAGIIPEPFACGSYGAGRGSVWVSARGELDLASAPELQQTLQEALGRALLIIVDLRAVTFIDSAGLDVIIDADARARQTGHRVVLIRGPESVDRTFTLAGVTDQLRIVDLQLGLESADPRRFVDVCERQLISRPPFRQPRVSVARRRLTGPPVSVRPDDIA